MDKDFTSLLSDFEDFLRYELRRSPHTVDAYLSDVSEFASFMKENSMGPKRKETGSEETDACGATQTDIRRWLASLSEEKMQASSIRRKTVSLRVFFRHLCRLRVRTDNPTDGIPLLKLSRKLPAFVKSEEIEELLEDKEENASKEETNTGMSDSKEELVGEGGSESKAPDVKKEVRAERDKLVIEMLYTTGLRRSELIGINDSDVNIHSKELKVRGKGNKERVIPLAEDTLSKIRHWQKTRDSVIGGGDTDTPLFLTPRGRMSATTLREIVKNGLEGVNVGKKSPHTLRHTFATAMLNGGADINDVKELLGHSTLSTTQIYTHVSFAQMRESYSKAHPRAAGKKFSKEKD